jgi:glycosyltransferase involved in cell wall biosynthesis
VADKLRLLLLIPRLGTGGAEQVIALLARGLSREKYDLHLGLVTQKEHDLEAAPPWVAVHPLGSSRVRRGAFRLLRLVKKLKPDLILSGTAQLNFLVLLLRPFYPNGTHVLVRQNGIVSSVLTFEGAPWYTRLLYKTLYPRADRVICQSEAIANDLCREIGIRRGRIAVLPNPVAIGGVRTENWLAARKSDQQPESSPGHWTGAGPRLLAVGPLTQEKGFDLLLEALSIVRVGFPQTSLVIHGTGVEEPALKTQSRSLGFEAAVRFTSQTESTATLYSQAWLFVHSSRHDDIPSSLLEAVAGGLPIVATPASSRVIDLLRGRPGIWLAREVSSRALAAALLKALEQLSPGQRFYRSLRSVS